MVRCHELHPFSTAPPELGVAGGAGADPSCRQAGLHPEQEASLWIGHELYFMAFFYLSIVALKGMFYMYDAVDTYFAPIEKKKTLGKKTN